MGEALAAGARAGGEAVTGFSPKTRALILERDGYRCVACGSTRDLEIQHVRARGMGGSRLPWVNSAGNGILLCRTDHATCEARAEVMHIGGYWRYSWQKPGPVYYAAEDRWYWLNDDGTRTLAEAVA